MDEIRDEDIRDPEEFTDEEPTEIVCQAEGIRLDVQLAAESGLSRSRVAALMDAGFCTVDGRAERKAGAKPKPGAQVRLQIPLPVPAFPQPEDLPLEILYEDSDLAVVVKPAGMVTHPAPGHDTGTLVNALLFHLKNLGGIGGELRPGIVHRLDKDTSGLLLVAKTDAVQQALSEQLAQRRVTKHYLALAEGSFKTEYGLIDQPIARHKTDRKKMAIDPDGRPSQTEWRLLEAGRQCALLDVHILTGRTHQIRVHLRSISHPVCGDPIYGYSQGVRVPRLMLHAWQLSFSHPLTGKTMSITADPPEAFLEGLRKNGIRWPTLSSD